jgi:hypothetical protein
VFLIILVLISIACSSRKRDEGQKGLAVNFPENLKITSKAIALDITWSNGLVSCEKILERVNTLNSCILMKGSKRYIRKFTLLFATAFYDAYAYCSLGLVPEDGGSVAINNYRHHLLKAVPNW